MPIHHVALNAADYEATRRFYIDGLGLTEAIAWGEAGGRACILAVPGGGHVEVFEQPDRAPASDSPALIHFAVQVDSTDAAYARALEHGATVVSPPELAHISGTREADVRIAFCRGLDGEVIEFFQSADL